MLYPSAWSSVNVVANFDRVVPMSTTVDLSDDLILIFNVGLGIFERVGYLCTLASCLSSL